MNAPNKMKIYLPPEIPSQGLSLDSHAIPKPTIYSFAFYIWQSLNHWPENGALDYQKNLLTYAPYLKPQFIRFLQADYNRRMNEGELQDRTSSLQALADATFEPKDVTYLGRNTWEVRLNMRLIEHMNMNEQKVKDTDITYVLRVVRYQVDANANPWGLALAGFVQSPSRLHTRI